MLTVAVLDFPVAVLPATVRSAEGGGDAVDVTVVDLGTGELDLLQTIVGGGPKDHRAVEVDIDATGIGDLPGDTVAGAELELGFAADGATGLLNGGTQTAVLVHPLHAVDLP